MLWQTAPIFSVPKPEFMKVGSIGAFVGAVGGLIFIVGILAFFVLLIMGSAQWIISGGDKAKLQAARERIMHALLGLSLLSMTLAVIMLIQAFLGVTIVGNNIPLPQAF